MIALIICGLFRCGLNLTLSVHLLTSSPLCLHPIGARVKAVQCDNGKEFDNSRTRHIFLTQGIHVRMSCPYTSPQNGKAKRIIRSINNVIRSLLFHASMPPSYWVEALSTATVLLNILPTKTPVLHAAPCPARHATGI
jgi:hypothetical protein